MQKRALLDIGALTDRDGLVVAPEDRAEPDPDVPSETDLPDHVRVGSDPVPSRLWELGLNASRL